METDHLIAAFLVLGFMALWYGVTLLIKKFRGWDDLQKAFSMYPIPPASDIDQKKFRFVSGHIGKMRYNNCLTVTTSHYGIGIKPWLIFGIGIPRIFIPWEAISSLQESTFLFINTTQFYFKNEVNIGVSLMGNLFTENPYVPNRLKPDQTNPHEQK